MRLIIIAALVLGTLALSQVPRTPAQGPDANGAPAAATQADAPHPLVGKWTYRSFRSDPDQATEPNALLFGQGTLEFDTVSPDRVTGTLGGEGWQLNLTGRMEGTSPVTVRFQGKGVINGEEWVYDYAGYLVPRWPNGVDQRPAVVGSIVRTKAHSQGTAKAGYVAQWIAVRQDATPPAPRERLTAPAAGADALLRKLQVEWAAAVGSNDPDRIGRFFGNDFLFVGAGGVLQNRAEHLNDFRTGRLKVQSVTVKDVTVVARETYALTSTLTSVKGTFAGADITADYRFMDTFERTKSGWFAVARQQTKVAKSPSPTAVALPPPATFRAATGSALIRHNPSSIHAPFGNLYSHGVEIPSGARLLYIAGQAGVSKDGKVPADPDAQLDLAWANLKAVLNTAGMTVNDLVKVNCYIKEAKYTDAYARSVQRHLPTLKPAMTAPVVRQLWSEDWYVEIDGVAAKLPAWGQAAPAATGAGEKAAQPQSTSTDKLRRMYQEEDRREQLRKGNLAPNASPRATEKAGPSPDSEQLRRMYEEEDRREQLRRQNLAPSTPRPESSPVKVIRSVNGALQATLEVKYGMVRIGNHDVWLRTYNGQPVGPTLRAKAGDTLYITLVNRLPVEPPSPGHPSNGHHDWNTTNLHFHGLHVAPQGTKDAESDNVLLKLKPSDPFDPAVSVQKYAVKIPGNHVAGTFWYHAHNHGSVAAQVASGLAGALIIERDDDRHNLDSVPAVRAAAEDILLLQQVPYLKVSAAPGTIERVPEGSVDAMLGPGAWRNLGRYITTNGTRIPTITIAPGEVRRLRFIHSGQREAIRLKIERPPASGKAGGGPAVFPFHEIATDGLPTGTCRQLDMLNLFPGYRSDVLVRAPDDASGEYYLVDTEWDDRETGLPRPEKGADGSPELLRWVAKIVVAGPRRDMRLPEQHELAAHALPSLVETPGMGLQHSFYGIYFPPLNLPPPEDELRFMVSRRNLASKHDDFVKPTEHLDKEYDPTNVRRLVLGRTEKWVVGSRNSPNPVDGGGPPAAVTHPFHIHTNPFLVTRVTSLVEPGQVGDPVDVTAREIGSPTWRDTLALQQGYTYELLTRYEDFPGSFYQHCHILDHEDRGMMELVRIEDPARPAAAPVPPGRGQPPLRVSRTIPAADSNPSALLFVKGSFCTHCMRQLTEMAQELSGRNVAVTVVSGSTEDDLKDFPALPFTLVADPRHELFKRYRVFDGEAKHGIIVLDAAGRERLRKVGDAPFTDTKTVLAALGQAAPGFMIAVRGTDAPADDYITWSPTPCTIRMTNGTPGDP
ncbi:MAG TPA: Rid family hydrolase, partial [Urbifossiella sp.]|nr:Rid family hydrolase [Urbifossiella sp.]